MHPQLKKIKNEGIEKLHVLSDFDRTLTLPIVNGKKIPSLISVLRDKGALTPDYAKKAITLFKHYHPIEINPRISAVIKKEAMNEWWIKHFELLIASGLTQNDIKHAMYSQHARLRADSHEFFALLQKNNIPLVILSASGLGIHSIRFFLEAENLFTSNVYIISNDFEWDENGKAIGYKKPIIHVMNKDETIVQNFPNIITNIQDRPNVILLGDSESDLDMIVGFTYNQLLTVGFCSDENAHGVFDILLDPESSLAPITKIIKHIIST